MDTPSRGATPTNARQTSSDMSAPTSHSVAHVDEETPLLVRHDSDNDETDDDTRPTALSSLVASIKRLGQRKPGAPRRWPSILALVFLCLVIVVILVAGFFAPEAVKDYAQQATVFEPTSLSIDSFTPAGIVARVQGDFVLDASRVDKQSTRNFGRLATWIARGVETKPSEVTITLPQYDDLLLGTAHVPPVVVSIVNGQHSRVDILTELKPGPVDGIRRIARDVIEGRLGDVMIAAKSDVALRSGILSFGSQAVTHILNFKSGDVPTMPKYSVQRLNVHEINVPGRVRGLAADVAVAIDNKYPVDIVIPPLGFSILANGCSPSDPYIMLADATTDEIHVKPKHDIPVNATGFLRQLPEEFLAECPDTQQSPLDVLVAHYMKGKPATFYVQGSDSPDVKTPRWISELSSGIIVPISMPNSAPDNMMRNFSMANLKFALPDFWAEPGTPAASPKISADIDAIISMPDQINFDVAVNTFRANATIFYKGNELGRLNLSQWQKAWSRLVDAPHKSHKDLKVFTHVEQAPLKITNDDVFQEVLAALLLGGDDVHMGIKAKVAIGMQTPLGDIAIQDIAAEGDVPVKPIGGGGDGGGNGGGRPGFDSLAVRVGDLKIVKTTVNSLTISAAVNFTNPTSYSAIVPYADVHILVNDTVLGHGTVKNLAMVPGNNTNAQLSAVWSPSAVDGHKGAAVGRELLSQFISGYNSTLTIKTHAGSIPAQPALGKALANFAITIPTSKLLTPDQPGDGSDGEAPSRPHFITDTIMHLFSSTATFTLHSPFAYTTLWLARLNATAYYKGDVVGKIINDGFIQVPPGDSETPRLPVDWSLNSAGYEALKSALGRGLFLSADATTAVRIGQYEEHVWYKGKGIGAKIRI